MLAKQAATQVLGGLYEAIADHSQVDAILTAMDEFLDVNPDGLESGDADWKQMFRDHFGRMGQFLNIDSSTSEESPIIHVDKQVIPAAVIDRNYGIVARNEMFERVHPADYDNLVEMFTTPNDRRRLDQLFKANGTAEPALVSLTLPKSESPVFAVASRSELLDLCGSVSAFVTLQVAKATWNANLVPLLESAYGLTTAEIEILEGLVETGAISQVAELRGRSVRTVRTQLTHVFGKLGLSSQTELALFLATLTQLMTKTGQPSDVGKSWIHPMSKELTRHTLSVGSRDLAYVKYGAPEGTPVLLIHSTTPPQMTPEFRRACTQANIRVIGVHKPGSGGASVRSAKNGPAELSSDYEAIMQAEGWDRALIAGHCSGGLYALQFAKDYPARAAGLILIDTGVPFKGRGELMALPKSFRRTFLPARYIPEVLIIPHRIFVANFRRSQAGEARVVDYFFDDCPVDQNLTRTDRTYYEITRQIIEYSFEDVDRLVADVCRWAQDWSSLLEGVSGPIVFCHGNENRLFSVSRIEAFAENRENIELVVVEGGGQLQVYYDTDSFPRAVRTILVHA
ncbi:MAG: alpha/beta fold hydrolase [Pseudomonadota bacterium]